MTQLHPCRSEESATVTTTLITRTAPHAARAAGRGVSALLTVALAPLSVDLSRMTWDNDRDETWM